MIFEIVHLKTLVFERREQLKVSSKILTDTVSDSLAILKRKLRADSCKLCSQDDPRLHFLSRNSIQNPHDTFPVPFP